MNATTPQTLSAPVQRGTCSICQWPTNTEDAITTCPACGLTFHAECWTENCGCSAYGCSQVNALPPQPASYAHHAAAQHPPAAAAASPPSSFVPSLEPAPQGISTGHAMLAASVIAGVLGLFSFGATSLIVLIASLVALSKHPRTTENKLLLLAAGVSLFGTIAGTLVSSIVWLGGSPGVSR